ncbi:MAG: hypothetical protein DCF18_07225 [Cyanobium sp.]|uniref:hypothetical protein n=1 Tax=Synechococcus sp. CS-1333 TaxID=2848638 RepID=UPI000DBC2AD1|nr:hypothetical protein [Synechococcus sp. CS-1333]MCT0210302.1 hypothetical protein [Synechococcus sp. CS-1333]PZV23304.1 MAG: hypothetical protein DCF18_07225 [Cyanobium sp.]
MHENQLVEDCLHRYGGALLFMAPEWSEAQRAVHCQIVDVFALQVVTGFTRDPQGKLLLEAHPSVAAGRSWSLAKAAQLVRLDARPERWVVLQRNNRAWGMFWAGGGLHRCRQELLETSQSTALSSALVPVTPEALLRLVLNLDAGDTAAAVTVLHADASPAAVGGSGVLKAVLWTSLAWLIVLALTAAGFLGVLREQDRKLELLLERLPPPASDR